MISFKNEVNTIYPSFAKQLGFSIRLIDVEVQKIDRTILDIYKIVVVAFSVVDKANQVGFFEKTFLVANISLEVVFGMFFLTLSSADIDFSDQELWWKIYSIKKAFPTTKCVEIVGKKEFAAIVLNLEYEIFVVYVASLLAAFLSSNLLNTNIHPFRRPQISGLIAEKAPIKVPAEYLDFADIFF